VSAAISGVSYLRRLNHWSAIRVSKWV
jgi:hypothetical protein